MYETLGSIIEPEDIILNILEKTLSFVSALLLILCALAPMKRTELAQRHTWIRSVTGFHTAYGIILLITGLAHGILTGSGPGMITGKLAWMLLLVLTLLTLLKKRTKQTVWRRIHIALGAVTCILVVMHIIQAVIF